MSLVTSVSKIMFIRGSNKLICHNKETFVKLLKNESQPLITVSNHRSNIDDPLMWCILKFREFWRYKDRHRYTLAAHNICFTKQFHTTMFSLGRCVPCVRGEGVYQKGMDFCVDMLNDNKWVHIFPEGKVCVAAEEPLRFKWGIGRLVMDAKTDPIILPVWCKRMEDVWPIHPPYYPKFGNTVEVYIGEPFSLSDLKKKISSKGLSTEQMRKIITDEVQTRMCQLGEKVNDLPKGSAQAILRKNPPIEY
ncbi:Protein CBR-ACL-3 [Caenorhabditis briggsae]|uniref:Tafazzin family protein n=1 Tax=Caenorhabditis briggsae TaxID=6238 RepID=A8X0W5_CAEBR|nr:Protein CBR-ACL-3 [Caenorhabditis briggsae]CAP26275.1 Protein CBR-ACL-3 [Caenorhabditis briggsae]